MMYRLIKGCRSSACSRAVMCLASISWLLLAPFAAVALAAPASVASVRICDDASEWPPFTFFQLENGKRTQEVRGFSVDVIQEILQQQGVKFKLDLHPWKRCLREVERGTQYQMLLSASDNADRRERFLFSESYYQTHPYYFYSKKHFPQGLPIKTIQDLKSFSIGGISGYNYDYLGVTAAEVNTESIDYRHLVLKLHHNRVEVFVEQIEVLQGFRYIGKPYLDDPDLGYAPLPGADPTRFHMMFTNNEQGRALRDLVNEGLQKLKGTGRFKALEQKYMTGTTR